MGKSDISAIFLPGRNFSNSIPKSTQPKLTRTISAFHCVLALLTVCPCTAEAQKRVFPDVPSFELPIASPRLAGFAGRLIKESIGDDRFGVEREADVRIGEDFPIVGLRSGPRPITLGFGVEVSGRFSLDDHKTSMISNDWQVGLNTHFNLAPWELDLQLYHESSHLGDEYADAFGARRLDWTREVLMLWTGYRAGSFRLIGSTGYVLADELNLSPWLGSAGVDFLGRDFSLLGLQAHLIAGIFTEAASATAWKLSSSAKIGFGFPGARVGRELRLSLVGHDGLSTQRQFFRSRSRYIGMEIEFQL